jgi:hypothetical protein
MRGWEKHAYLRHASTFEGEAGTMLAANTKTEYLREPGTKYIFKIFILHPLRPVAYCFFLQQWRMLSYLVTVMNYLRF